MLVNWSMVVLFGVALLVGILVFFLSEKKSVERRFSILLLCIILVFSVLPNVIFCEEVVVEGNVDRIEISGDSIIVMVDGVKMQCAIHSGVSDEVLALDEGDSAVFVCLDNGFPFTGRVYLIIVEVS